MTGVDVDRCGKYEDLFGRTPAPAVAANGEAGSNDQRGISCLYPVTAGDAAGVGASSADLCRLITAV